MADGFYCTENANACFDEFDCNSEFDPTRIQGSETPAGCASESEEERVRAMVERETEHLPRDDYLKRLQDGDLDLRVRRGEALDWIWKVHTLYSFGPLSVCLSMNYLDRFLSVYQLPMDKSWAVQLLSVACLSLAAKMEETEVPLSIDLQVGEPKYVFEGKTIQRMELLVLSTLKWKMKAITPFCFIDYFLSKITVGQQQQQHISSPYFCKTAQLILTTIKGIDFMEFRPSEIALAVAASIAGEVEAVDMEKSMASFPYIEKEKVEKCMELMKDLSVSNGYGSNGGNSNTRVPESPVGVLDAACLSYKSEELSVGSCPNSSSHHNIPDSKRRRPDTPSKS